MLVMSENADNLNTEIETIKYNQIKILDLKIPEKNRSKLGGLNIWLGITEVRVSEVENKSIEIIQTEQERAKRVGKEWIFSDLWDSIKCLTYV